MHCIRCKHDVAIPGLCGECAVLFHFVHDLSYFKQHHPPAKGLFLGPCVKEGVYYDLYIDHEFKAFSVPPTEDLGIRNEAIERVQYLVQYPHRVEQVALLTLADLAALSKGRRLGFITKSDMGCYNCIVYEPSTEEWFLWDNDLTDKDDAVSLMLEEGIAVSQTQPADILPWMTASEVLDLGT